MFCNRCGNELDPNTGKCSRCDTANPGGRNSRIFYTGEAAQSGGSYFKTPDASPDGTYFKAPDSLSGGRTMKQPEKERFDQWNDDALLRNDYDAAPKKSTGFRWKGWMTLSCAACALLILVMTIGVMVFRGGSGKTDGAEVLDHVIEELEAAEEDYLNDDGFVEMEDAQDLIDEVYDLVEDHEEVEYCEKNEFSVYMILSDGLGVHYYAPTEGLASSGDELQVSTYQPYFNAFSTYDLGAFNTRRPTVDYPDQAAEALTELDITESSVETLKNQDVTIEQAKRLSGNGVILWIGHGGHSEEYHSTLILSTEYTEALREQYKEDFEEHRLDVAVIDGWKRVELTPLFFEHYLKDGALENSIIYLGVCESGKDMVLANTLIAKGAEAVFVNSDTIYVDYNNEMCKSIVEALCDGKNARQAVDYAQDENGVYDHALFGLLKRETVVFCVGDEEMTLQKLYQQISPEEPDTDIPTQPSVEDEPVQSGTDVADGTYRYSLVEFPYFDGEYLYLNLMQDFQDVSYWYGKNSQPSICHVAYESAMGADYLDFYMYVEQFSSVGNGAYEIQGRSLDGTAWVSCRIEADGYLEYTWQPYSDEYVGGTYDGYSARVQFTQYAELPIAGNCVCYDERGGNGSSVPITFEQALAVIEGRDGEWTDFITVTVKNGKITELIIPYIE